VKANDDVDCGDGHERRPGEARCSQPAEVDPAHAAQFAQRPPFPAPGAGAVPAPGHQSEPQIDVVGTSIALSSSGIVAAGSRNRSGFLSCTTTRNT
jgi:hypothetical protein